MEKTRKPEKNYDVPLKLVNAVGAAALMGVTRQRFAQLFEGNSSRLPEPIAFVNDRWPVWLESDFQQDC